jgi:hypothetical protein
MWFVVARIYLISKKRKGRLLNTINTRLSNLERKKNPKNKLNRDMLVDAEIRVGRRQ